MQRQAHRSRRDRSHQIVEEHLRIDAAVRCELLLAEAELPLEPGDHPVAPVDLDLHQVVIGHGSRVGRQEGQGLDIAPVGRVDRRRRPIAQGADRRLDASRAQDFAGLVGGGSDDGQTGREPNFLCGRRCQFTKN